MHWTGNDPRTLAGVRVLDLTRLLPGPFCTTLLADLGADVIKIEEPGQGDWARWVPPLVGTGAHSMGALFAAVNRGKRSLALNLKTNRGRALLMQLLGSADVLVESFRPGVMDRLGLGPEALRKARPPLIYCALTGYGQEGHFRERAGHDLNYLALTGCLEQTGLASGPPHPPGFQPADILGGTLYGALTIVAALLHRERTGEGASLDVAIAEGAATFMAPSFARLDAGEPLPERGRDQLTGGFPCYAVYKTKDGCHLAVAALEPKFWTRLCQTLGHPEWASRGHQSDSPVHRELADLFLSRTQKEWLDLLDGQDLCVEPVLSPVEALESELFAQREVFFRLGGGGRPRSLQTATPITPRTGRDRLRPPPLLGEHSREVLGKLQLSANEIDELVREGVVQTSDSPDNPPK